MSETTNQNTPTAGMHAVSEVPPVQRMLTTSDYLDLSNTAHVALFENSTYVWDALDKIATYLKFRLKPGIKGTLVGRPFVSNQVFVGEGTVIEHGAMLRGPAWIGSNCHIRNGAYIRENVVVGDGVVLGNSCEFKNCIIFDGAQVPHFNYVGDSILGYKAHLGAGVILSNVRLDNEVVQIQTPQGSVSTGRRKFGAVVGDFAEIGCNSVISPGSLLGRRSVIYPGSHWRGVLPPHSIAKHVQTFRIIERHQDPAH